MSEIVRPLDFESQMIIGVNHFMRHRVLKMPLVFHFICTEKYSVVGIKPSCFSIRAPTTIDIVAGEVTSELANVVAQIANNWA